MATSIKVILYTSKTLSNGEHPIMIRIIKDRKAKYIKIGFSCSEKLWDKKKNLPNKNHPSYQELITLISKKRLDADKILLSLENEANNYSSETIQKKLKRNHTTISVLEYFQETIDGLEKKGRIGYANVFISTRNSFKTFLKKKDINFNEINLSLLLKYEESLKAKGNSLNTQFICLRTLKTLINYAQKEELLSSDYNPFKDFSFKKFRNIKTEKRALTREQLQEIFKLDIKEDDKLFDAKNYFLFSYYNSGMNFIDMAYLKWNQINKDVLQYTRKKTNQLFKIKLLDPAIEILNYYKQFSHGEGNEYVFPILNSLHNTPKSRDNRIDKVLKLVNADLKKIADKAGIDEKLTTYVARHSAATIMKRSGISQSIISESLGHTSEKTTRIYLDSFDDDTLYQATKSLLI
jgi:integrase